MKTPIDLEMMSASAGQTVELGVVSAPEGRQGQGGGQGWGQAGVVRGGGGGTTEPPLIGLMIGVVGLSHWPDIWRDLEVNLGVRQGIHPANTFLSLIRPGLEGIS